MSSEGLRVTVIINYGDDMVRANATTPFLGNPLYAPREATELGVKAMEKALNMLRGATGDIDVAPSVDPRSVV